MEPAASRYVIEPDFHLVRVDLDAAGKEIRREKLPQLFDLVAQNSPLLQHVSKEVLIECCKRYPELTAACDEMMLKLVADNYPVAEPAPEVEAAPAKKSKALKAS